MSQLLGRIAKLSSSSSSSVLKKQRLCLSGFQPFSTAVAATPYLLSNSTNRRSRTPTRDEFTVDLNLYDPMKDEQVKIPDHTLPMELVRTLRIGSSRGWLALKNLGDNTVRLTNMLNPCASASSHKVITLPPLNDTKAYGICLLGSPNEQDCVVAAKSCSNLISLCRPGDSDWTQIKLPERSLSVMYSARDNKFYLHKEGKVDECDDNNIECSSSFPQVCLSQSFPNSDLPESKRNLVISSSKTEYLIESPTSGESFIVYWCDDFMTKKKPSCMGQKHPYKRTPTTFVVFRQDPEQRINSYTQDIGDLCIFLGIGGDAFCVSATEYPGLKPNSIYYARRFTGFGFYDLASNTLHPVVDEPAYSDSYTWLAPLSH